MPRQRSTRSVLAVPALLLVAACGRPDLDPTGPEDEQQDGTVQPALESVAFDRLGGGTILFQRIGTLVEARGLELVGLYRVDGGARTSTPFLFRLPVYMPALAPDGERLAFIAFSGTSFDVYVAGLDGTQVRRLSNDAGDVELAPTWTPDGAAAYVVAGGRTVNGRTASDIVRQSASAAVGERTFLATLTPGGTPANNECPTIFGGDDTPVAVSAQGTIVFVCRRNSLYALAPGGSPTLVYAPPAPSTGGGEAELAAPAWSADGLRLAFLEIRRGTGVDTTMVRRFEVGSSGAIPSGTPALLGRVTKTAGQLFEWSGTFSLCWLPNAVAFTAPESDRVAHVYVVPAAGGDAVQFTTAPNVFDRSVSCRS